MAQRYLALRKTTDDDDRLHFWIGELQKRAMWMTLLIIIDVLANPGSLVWLTSDRPHPDDTCSGVDTFKYGLADGFPAYDTTDAKNLGRDGLASRYRDRNAHYAWGLVSLPHNQTTGALAQSSILISM